MIHVEHVAWQVHDPVAVARWYCEVLGFRVLRKVDQVPFTHFLADAAGMFVLEIYHNPAAMVLEYPNLHPLQLHLAFAVDDPAATRDAMLRAGASIAEDVTVTPAGDTLVMMRDPFGFAIQFCRRATPML